MSIKSVAGFGFIKRFFKVVELTVVSSRPLVVQGTAKYHTVGVNPNEWMPLIVFVVPTKPPPDTDDTASFLYNGAV